MSQEETPYTTDSKNYEDTLDKVSQFGSKIARKGKEAVLELSGEARKLGATVSHTVDRARSSLGEKMATLADSIQEEAPSEGVLASAAGAVVSGIKTSGQYLSDHGVKSLTDEMTRLVRKYPFYSLWTGVGIGVLLGTMISRSKS